ncbi:hypothetical protein O980_17890 [Mycobacterium avium subsp. paratuberculosis 08-8281]|nr:hypothetical protein O980_17890 [Mycobacterium avium subsp. paratuberculosis 08-8281]
MGTPRGARARALADALSLPLADAIACHAEALRAGNGEALLTVAAAYRAIGDAAAAADARRAGLRRVRRGAAAPARAVCGGPGR